MNYTYCIFELHLCLMDVVSPRDTFARIRVLSARCLWKSILEPFGFPLSGFLATWTGQDGSKAGLRALKKCPRAPKRPQLETELERGIEHQAECNFNINLNFNLNFNLIFRFNFNFSASLHFWVHHMHHCIFGSRGKRSKDAVTACLLRRLFVCLGEMYPP